MLLNKYYIYHMQNPKCSKCHNKLDKNQNMSTFVCFQVKEAFPDSSIIFPWHK